jgi:hypothetical protein
MAFATETFSGVPLGGLTFPSHKLRMALAGAAALGLATVSLAWMVGTLATMQTMAVSLSPTSGNMPHLSLASKAIQHATDTSSQRLIHVSKFSRLHPLLSAEKQALSDALDVARGNRQNATKKLAAAVVQNALKVAMANAASQPPTNAIAVASATAMVPPGADLPKPVLADLASTPAIAAVDRATHLALAAPAIAAAPVTSAIGPMEKAVDVALADAASPQMDDAGDFVAPIPNARPVIATASLPDGAAAEDPFNLVMADASSDDDDQGDSVPLPATRPRGTAGNSRTIAEERFRRPSEHVLAYARADDGMSDDAPTFNNAISLPGGHNRVAVYDISAGTVYLPSGEKLEAHSGLGGMLDNPRFVSQKNRGPTPPNTYALTLRESLFHGVQALRMTPVASGNVYGRTGLLAHTYMLGRRGDSNGCVVFKDYRRFLAAYQRGEVTRMVVVPRLSGSSTRVASLTSSTR